VLALGALGVVFGDIGTSPLYAMRTILGEGSDLSRTTVYGMTSLVIWALLLVVTALYVGLLLGSDNEGEGGRLALLALLRRTSPGARMSHWRQRLFLLIDRLSTDRVTSWTFPFGRTPAPTTGWRASAPHASGPRSPQAVLGVVVRWFRTHGARGWHRCNRAGTARRQVGGGLVHVGGVDDGCGDLSELGVAL
jgi:hypothetical protein